MREAPGPAQPNHRAAHPTVGGPEEQHLPAHERRAQHQFGRRRKPPTCRRGRRGDRDRDLRTPPRAGTGSEATAVRRAVRRVGAMASYSATSSRQWSSCSNRTQASSGAACPRQRTRYCMDPRYRRRLSSSSTSCSPSCPASETGPGGGGASARSKKGLSRSTLTIGLQRIVRGSARVRALGWERPSP